MKKKIITATNKDGIMIIDTNIPIQHKDCFDYNKEIYESLRLGLKQTEVARIAGVSRQRIHQIRNELRKKGYL